MNWLQALFKTRRGLLQQTPTTLNENIEINDEFYNDLLEKFIKADR